MLHRRFPALGLLRSVADAVLRAAAPPRQGRRSAAAEHAGTPAGRSPAPTRRAYPGDAESVGDTAYAPRPDGRPDPGEIVWTWVPYEEDHSLGKDRPVLLVGRDGGWLVGLPLTSKDHDRDAEQERAAGREWVDIGTGPWDRRGRPSEVRTNRLVRVDPAAIRREGAVLGRARYDEVIAALRRAERA
ncbi:MAG TPA: type II toxin-antitoxin system PemK/MazF family toxin [Intrasporangium sp.]|uniref:type II toxin-antitoxin system PemK/MazF family toxin n=1 Tax=Intrasporangium sp. TaxID=1925024 RepID=UPI002D76B373|nr:type II toxin-antitoxin system PemK/MazF family toxin [Intrasporangium sp.]HET7397307.1 type II toxin-antitoxin system PemK/MazF family toxin [Intrasporangium sp.]